MTAGTKDGSLFSPAMLAVLVAQFLSALADNAVLIVAITLVRAGGPAGLVPLLQGAFVVPFVLLAPFAGPIADGFPKGRVMLLANLLKLAGAGAMAAGLNPLAAYALIGIGATVYSPAKYGILTELVGPESLVRANGMLEGSTIVAILLGVLFGGWLADRSLSLALAGVVAAYLLAAAANLFIPRLAPERPVADWRLAAMVQRFLLSLQTLFSDPAARFSLFGTGIFWGSGVTLRLMLFAWVPVALSLGGAQAPADLMGIVSLGIVLGAIAAGAWISLGSTNRALLGGVLLGPAIFLLAGVSDYRSAAVFMAVIGLSGGLFVVPLNALLQETGHRSVGAGSALAVQNFTENLAMLLFVGAYSLSTAREVPVTHSVRHFGATIFLSVLALAFFRMRGFGLVPGLMRTKGRSKAVE